MPYLFFLYCCLFGCNTTAQQLLGRYSVVHEGIGSSETLYRFYDDGTFVYQSWDDVGDYFGRGTFVLSKKQITFQFLTIPEGLKTETVFSKENNDTCFTLRVFNPLIPHERPEFSFQINRQDTIVRKGNSDALGLAQFQLYPQEEMIVYVQDTNPLPSFFSFSQFTITTDAHSKDFIISTHGLKAYTQFLKEKSVSYPMRLKQKGKSFLLKKQGEWVLYNRID
jgi:hypothetical protein